MINEALIKDDFYMAVNGDWLKTATIPDDKYSTGGFSDLRDDTEKLLMEEIDALSADKSKVTSDKMEQMIRFYDLATDFKTRDELGAKPIISYLSKLQSLKNYDDFKEICYEWILNQFELPFKLYVYLDMKHSSKYALYLNRAQLILPDKTYYEEGHKDQARLLEIYRKMSLELLEICGISNAEETVRLAIEFDALLAPHCKSSEELADYTTTYNPRSSGHSSDLQEPPQHSIQPQWNVKILPRRDLLDPARAFNPATMECKREKPKTPPPLRPSIQSSHNGM